MNKLLLFFLSLLFLSSSAINLLRPRNLVFASLGTMLAYRAYDRGAFDENRYRLVRLVEDTIHEYSFFIEQLLLLHASKNFASVDMNRVSYYQECINQLLEIKKRNRLVPNLVIETQFLSERENDLIWSSFVSKLSIIEKNSGKAAS
jgi:hypothetical protein